ncbi:aldo/keto reductase [candidate division KSB1 bacterium]|nr:aldo/keto reductase [candidate division KSB1 bacterium]
MQYRFLGRTGLKVSEIAFGGVEIGLAYGIGVHSEADMPTEAQSISLLHHSQESGVNFYDTARMYGRSETLIGKAFQQQRQQVILCSKCAHLPHQNGRLPKGDDLQKLISASLEISLKELRTDYIDIYMLHNAGIDILENRAIAQAFAAFKAQGRIRATGVSTYSVAETRLAIEQGVWDVIQLPFNLMDQRQAALFAPAEKAGIGLVIRSVLLKGILSDKGRHLHPSLKIVQEHRDRYGELLNFKRPSLSCLATKFALSFEQVASVLVGIDHIDYLQQALTAANGRYLDDEERARAQELAFPDPEFIDLPSWDRLGWLK